MPILNSLLAEHANDDLGPGVRALLLYPMNALANDQLKRLREALRVCPQITFGRYTGETTESARDAESEFTAANPGALRLPNELLSREEMRKSPPHLLLTNYAMLEYLLLRPADIELFDGPYARQWRFLVLDEAHVYDGAQGSEVALLLRRLHQRVTPSGKLQCVATSASLEGSTPDAGPGEAMRFARDLFNAEFDYSPTDPAKQDLVRPTRQESRSTPTWQLSDDQILRLGVDGSLEEIVGPLTGASPALALQNERTIADLKAALAAGPVEVADLQRRLWPDEPMSAKKLEALVALEAGCWTATEIRFSRLAITCSSARRKVHSSASPTTVRESSWDGMKLTPTPDVRCSNSERASAVVPFILLVMSNSGTAGNTSCLQRKTIRRSSGWSSSTAPVTPCWMKTTRLSRHRNRRRSDSSGDLLGLRFSR